MYQAKILRDSISDEGYRLTTFVCTYPRMVHAEFLTHRMLSRNGESSRARPLRAQPGKTPGTLDLLERDPFVPVFGGNKPGMQADANFEDQMTAENLWRSACLDMTSCAGRLAELNVHKSWANRVVEPFSWYTAIYSATDWDNFFALRTHPDAQPELCTIAKMMQKLYKESEPTPTVSDDWHAPLLDDDEVFDAIVSENWGYWTKVSVGRCARVSYLTHDGKKDPEADVALHDRLLDSRHCSPFEHVARPFGSGEWVLIDTLQQHAKFMGHDSQQGLVERLCDKMEYVGNLRGWCSLRAAIPFEEDASLYLQTNPVS